MTFVNTIDGKLLNLSQCKEIIFYNMDIGEESLGVKCECKIDRDEFLLGFFKTYDTACEEFQVIFLKPFYKFDISFRDLLEDGCEKFKQLKKNMMQKNTESFFELFEQSEKMSHELWKQVVFEECLIEM